MTPFYRILTLAYGRKPKATFVSSELMGIRPAFMGKTPRQMVPKGGGALCPD
jgi:hypothetical protein